MVSSRNSDAAVRGLGRWWIGAITTVSLLVLWEVLSLVKVLDYEFLPTPLEIATAGWRLAIRGPLIGAIGHTIYASFIGWAIGCASGIVVGLVIGLSRHCWTYGMASVEILRAVPAIALVPAAILVFGFSLSTELAIVVYACWWPVVIGTIAGTRNMAPRHHDVAMQFRLGILARVWKIVLPGAMREVLVGMRLGLSLSLALAVVTEMIGNPVGVGFELVLAQQALAADEMFAYVVIIGMLGVIFNGVFLLACRLAMPGVMRSARLGAG